MQITCTSLLRDNLPTPHHVIVYRLDDQLIILMLTNIVKAEKADYELEKS